MAKLNKMYYYTSKGEKKINRYYVSIPRELVEKLDLQDKEVEVKIIDNKIVVDKKN